MLPCRRFADVLADACARLGADVDRYSFIEVDLHHKLLAGLPAHSLALRPAHSRRHLYVTSYTEGFSHFVTSMTAPVASGWSVRRVGLAPTGKRRLLTAHANSGHSPNCATNGSIQRCAAIPIDSAQQCQGGDGSRRCCQVHPVLSFLQKGRRSADCAGFPQFATQRIFQD